MLQHQKLRRIRILLLAPSCMMVGVVAQAAEPAISPTVLNANNEVSISVNLLNRNYAERSSGGFSRPFDRENGWVPGFTIKGQKTFDVDGITGLFGALTFSHNSGNVNYYSPPPFQYYGNTNYGINNVNIKFGRIIQIKPKFYALPYAVIGYRSWERELLGSYGYNEHYSNLYAGIGTKFEYSFTERLLFTLNLRIAEELGAHMTASGGTLSGIPSSFLHFDLGGRPDWKIGAGYDYAISRHIHLIGNFSFDQFGYGASVPGTSPFFEPSSRTKDVTAAVGFAYNF